MTNIYEKEREDISKIIKKEIDEYKSNFNNLIHSSWSISSKDKYWKMEFLVNGDLKSVPLANDEINSFSNNDSIRNAIIARVKDKIL